MNLERALKTILITMLFSSIAIAQSVRAPASFELTPDSKEFTIQASNDFSNAQLLGIAWSSPIGYTIEPAPTSLPAYSSQTFKIKLLPTKEQSNQVIQTTLRVNIGSIETVKKIELSIGDFSKSSSTMGFFALPSILGLEEIVDGVLIAIIIILVIAIVARLANKKRKQEAFQ